MLTAVGKAVSTVEETVTLDNGGFTALELNSRPIHVKGVFLRKNGTRYCKERSLCLRYLVNLTRANSLDSLVFQHENLFD